MTSAMISDWMLKIELAITRGGRYDQNLTPQYEKFISRWQYISQYSYF